MGERWKLDKYFSKHGQSYVEWLRAEEASLAGLYGYAPSADQLRRVVAAALVDEKDFLAYLGNRGGKRVLEDEDALLKLAKVAACIIVGLYLDGTQIHLSSDLRSSRGS